MKIKIACKKNKLKWKVCECTIKCATTAYIIRMTVTHASVLRMLAKVLETSNYKFISKYVQYISRDFAEIMRTKWWCAFIGISKTKQSKQKRMKIPSNTIISIFCLNFYFWFYIEESQTFVSLCRMYQSLTLNVPHENR